MTRISATIPLTVTLLSPLHHGAGVSGNSQLLRTQEIVTPQGDSAVVPFVSGNSLRHAIRHACAELTLHAVDAKEGELSRPMVDLLYSGGALTASETPQVDLSTHRKLDNLWAPAGLLGYSGRGQIWAGTLYVDHLNLVCAENQWRMPAGLRDHPQAGLPAAALRDEEFGTRHDPVGSSADRWFQLWEGEDAEDAEEAPQSSQMIYDWQVVKAGATMFGTLRLAAATATHVQALQVAWQWLTSAGVLHLGAKRAQGYGVCRVEADWSQLPAIDQSWVEQLGVHRDELMSLLATAAGK